MKYTSTSKQFFTQMNLIYFSQMAAMLLFAAVAFTVVFMGQVVPTNDKEFATLIMYTMVAVVIAGVIGAQFLYPWLLSRIDKNIEFKKRMPKYFGALLARGACLEVPGLFASIVFFITGNIYVLLIPIFIAALFYIFRPTPNAIAEDMKLSEEEKALLNDPDAIVAQRD